MPPFLCQVFVLWRLRGVIAEPLTTIIEQNVEQDKCVLDLSSRKHYNDTNEAFASNARSATKIIRR